MRKNIFLSSFLIIGYIFLFLPIIMMIVYSFNSSQLVTVWAGFSVKWYYSLFNNQQMINGLFLSLQIAVISASFATILGTIAAYVMFRFSPFYGQSLFSGILAAPLVIPDIVTGISLLLLFVSSQYLLGWPAERGFATIIIAHITFGMAYVAVVVRARLYALDMSVEEAALDLGARPLEVFFKVTVPMLLPALVAGWLLAFTLSFDDLIIASFVSGPGANTLPMIIFSKVKLGVSPEVNALATIMIAGVSFVVIIIGLLSSRNQNKIS